MIKNIWRRIWLYWVIGGIAVTFTAWCTLVYILDVNQYHSQIEKEIATATGMSVSIGRIGIHIFPAPNISARSIKLNKGDFSASSESVRFYVGLKALLQKRISIPSITIKGLQVILPSDSAELRKNIYFFKDSPEKHSQSAILDSLSIGQIRILDAYLFHRSSTGKDLFPMAHCDILIKDVLSDKIHITLQTHLPQYGDKSRFRGNLEFQPGTHQKSFSITGNITWKELELNKFIRTPLAPIVTTNGSVSISSTPEGIIKGFVKGALNAPVKIPAAKALTGTFTITAWWDHGTFTLNNIEINTQGIQIEGNCTRYKTGLFAVEIPHAQVNRKGLDPLFSLLSHANKHIRPHKDASLQIDNFLFGTDGIHPPRLVKGDIHIQGIDIVDQTNQPLLSGIQGSITISNNIIHIKRIGTSDLWVKGSLTPDFNTHSTTLDLTGKMVLTRKHIAAFVSPGPIREISGTITLDQIRATWSPGSSLPSELHIQGTLSSGKARIEAGVYQDTLADLFAKFSTDGSVIQTQVSGHSDWLGQVAVEGAWNNIQAQWEGAVTTNFAGLDQFLPGDTPIQQALGSLVRIVRGSPIHIRIDASQLSRQGIALEIRHTSPPEIDAESHFLPLSGKFTGARVTAKLPAQCFTPFISETICLSGDIPVSFIWNSAKEQFTSTLDLTPCILKAPVNTDVQLLDKKTGVPLAISLQGEASKRWVLRNIAVRVDKQEIKGIVKDKRFISEPFNLTLDKLAVLLPEHSSLSGHISGSFVTNPFELDLSCEQAKIELTPQATLGYITGNITIHHDSWSCPHLTITGPHVNCTLQAENTASGWKGTLEGSRLDLNSLVLLAATVKRLSLFQTGAETSKKTISSCSQDKGILNVQLQEVQYQRAHFSDVKATILMDHSGISVQDLTTRPYTGELSGNIHIKNTPEKEKRTVNTDLQFTGIDARIIDDLAFQTPRKLRGKMTGEIHLQFPIGEEIDPLEHVSGTLTFTGEKGSFGTLGIITKILTVLRTTEIVQLRIPHLRDQGLAYDTCRGTALLRDGLCTLKEFHAQNPTLHVTATGLIDFPNNNTNIGVDVVLFGPVSNLLDTLGLRSDAKELRKSSSFHLVVTGPPETPNVRITQSKIIDQIHQKVQEELQKKGVDKQLQDAATSLLDQLLGIPSSEKHK